MRVFRTSLLLAACLAAGSALAHRGHDTLSVVEVDRASGTVLVTHRLAAHDIEPGVLRQIAPQAQPNLDDPQALQALTDYVAGHFALADAGGPISLSLDGSSLSGDDIELRYRGRLKDASKTEALRVNANLFADVYPEVDNQVNVRSDGVTRTLWFGDGQPWQSVPLAACKAR